MDGAEEQGRVVLETGLGAVAVVHVEIDHGDLGHARRSCRHGGDGGVGEEAKAHGRVGLGVMPWGAHGAERPVHLAPRDRQSRLGHGARCAQGRLQTARGHGGVRVEARATVLGFGGEDAVDEGFRMRALQRLAGGLGGFTSVAGEAAILQRVQHGAQALGSFGVPLAVGMADHGGVGEEGKRHARHSAQSPRLRKGGGSHKKILLARALRVV